MGRKEIINEIERTRLRKASISFVEDAAALNLFHSSIQKLLTSPNDFEKVREQLVQLSATAFNMIERIDLEYSQALPSNNPNQGYNPNQGFPVRVRYGAPPITGPRLENDEDV